MFECFSLHYSKSVFFLQLMGDFDEFERAVKLVLENVRFDRDVVVSVFETNIRVVGYYLVFILNFKLKSILLG